MTTAVEEKVRSRERRRQHIRKKIFGTVTRPRLSVFRSQKQIYAQLIDDQNGRTLASVSSLESKFRKSKKGSNPIKLATEVGAQLAERARAQGITQVIFDRGGYLYHGRVKALAEGAREGGLKF